MERGLKKEILHEKCLKSKQKKNTYEEQQHSTKCWRLHLSEILNHKKRIQEIS